MSSRFEIFQPWDVIPEWGQQQEEKDPNPANIDLRARSEAIKRFHGYIPTGLDYLDDRLLGLMKTDFLLIGAETGAGKTTLAQMMAKLAAENNRRATFFALEAYKGEVSDRFLYREIAHLAWGAFDPYAKLLTFRRWLAGECKQIDDRYREKAIENIKPWAERIRVFYRDQKFDADDLTRELMAEVENTDFFIFDHIHYVDVDDLNENRGLREVTKALRNITLITEKPVVAVAHLRKRPGFEKNARLVPTKDDFHGSSDLIKIATQVVILAPGNVDQDDADKAVTYVRLDKERYDGTSDNWVARMEFNRKTSTYESGYQLGLLKEGATEIEIIDKRKLPRWAQRASNVIAPDPVVESDKKKSVGKNPMVDTVEEAGMALRRGQS